MKTTGRTEFSEFEKYHRGKESGEEKKRASAFWSKVQNQRMTQSDRRADTKPMPAKGGKPGREEKGSQNSDNSLLR